MARASPVCFSPPFDAIIDEDGYSSGWISAKSHPCSLLLNQYTRRVRARVPKPPRRSKPEGTETDSDQEIKKVHKESQKRAAPADSGHVRARSKTVPVC